MGLIAYHGSIAEKRAALKQIKAHAKADEIVKGQYWENGRGCAIGCQIHSSNHADYEPQFGIPQMLAKLEDQIFEGLPTARARRWPIQFMSAIKPGANLSLVGWKFLYWLLTDEEVNPGIANPQVSAQVKQCADVLVPLTKGQPVDISAAHSAAYSAACAAYSAAYSAASAAHSAASAAASAAHSAASAAASAASAAYSAAAAAYSATSAAKAAYVLMADKLLSLLNVAK